jgi:AbrB family looped-hinge helix DNA binding protein
MTDLCHPNGNVHGMRTTMDKAGRLVIPRAMRDRLGLTDGGQVDVQLDGAGLRIEPVGGNDLVERDGLLIIPATGSAITAAGARELLDHEREDRG